MFKNYECGLMSLRLVMASNERGKSANASLEALLDKALFDEEALLYDDESLPESGKTPTTPVQRADLAAQWMGARGT